MIQKNLTFKKYCHKKQLKSQKRYQKNIVKIQPLHKEQIKNYSTKCQ